MEIQPCDFNFFESLASNAEWTHEKSAKVAIKLYRGHKGSIKTCQLIENKNWILTGSDDDTARLWDFHSGKELRIYRLNHDMAAVSAVRINHDLTRLYSSSWDKTIRCIDVETNREIWKAIDEYVLTNCQLSHNNESLCSSTDLDGIISIWDAKTGLKKTSIRHLHESVITSCQFDMSDERIISTSFDKSTKIFDLISHRTTMTLRDHQSAVTNCTFDPAERFYATCSWDKTIRLYDITVGRFRHEGPLVLPKIHEGVIAACHISNDCKLLVSAGWDSKVILWDLENMTHKLVLRGHQDWVNDVCLSSDYKWIVSVSKDGGIRLWHIEYCDEIKQVIEQNKRLNKVKIANCYKCGKLFSINKLRRDPCSSIFVCLFCHHEQASPE